MQISTSSKFGEEFIEDAFDGGIMGDETPTSRVSNFIRKILFENGFLSKITIRLILSWKNSVYVIKKKRLIKISHFYLKFIKFLNIFVSFAT